MIEEDISKVKEELREVKEELQSLHESMSMLTLLLPDDVAARLIQDWEEPRKARYLTLRTGVQLTSMNWSGIGVRVFNNKERRWEDRPCEDEVVVAMVNKLNACGAQIRFME